MESSIRIRLILAMNLLVVGVGAAVGWTAVAVTGHVIEHRLVDESAQNAAGIFKTMRLPQSDLMMAQLRQILGAEVASGPADAPEVAATSLSEPQAHDLRAVVAQGPPPRRVTLAGRAYLVGTAEVPGRAICRANREADAALRLGAGVQRRRCQAGLGADADVGDRRGRRSGHAAGVLALDDDSAADPAAGDAHGRPVGAGRRGRTGGSGGRRRRPGTPGNRPAGEVLRSVAGQAGGSATAVGAVGPPGHGGATVGCDGPRVAEPPERHQDERAGPGRRTGPDRCERQRPRPDHQRGRPHGPVPGGTPGPCRRRRAGGAARSGDAAATAPGRSVPVGAGAGRAAVPARRRRDPPPVGRGGAPGPGRRDAGAPGDPELRPERPRRHAGRRRADGLDAGGRRRHRTIFRVRHRPGRTSS